MRIQKRGRVMMFGVYAGVVAQDEEGYSFMYDAGYLRNDAAPAISLTLPKREEPYRSRTMIPFFDGLIPEGWLLNISAKRWNIDRRDRMELLLTVCEDTIGAVEIYREFLPENGASEQ
jgi:serine/threonine-protein kinase HipA